MSDMCNDNRFDLIDKYKKMLIDGTNIDSSPDEMKVLDDILFRFWQMDWLDDLEETNKLKNKDKFIHAGKELFNLGIKRFEVVNGAWIGEIHENKLLCMDYNHNIVKEIDLTDDIELDLRISVIEYQDT